MLETKSLGSPLVFTITPYGEVWEFMHQQFEFPQERNSRVVQNDRMALQQTPLINQT